MQLLVLLACCSAAGCGDFAASSTAGRDVLRKSRPSSHRLTSHTLAPSPHDLTLTISPSRPSAILRRRTLSLPAPELIAADGARSYQPPLLRSTPVEPNTAAGGSTEVAPGSSVQARDGISVIRDGVRRGLRWLQVQASPKTDCEWSRVGGGGAVMDLGRGRHRGWPRGWEQVAGGCAAISDLGRHRG